MKRRITRYAFLVLMTAALLLFGVFGTAQTNPRTNTADQQLITFILDDFEDAGTWISEMPRDQGVIFSMKRKGAPRKVKARVAAIKKVNEDYIKRNSKGRQIKENPLAGFPYNDNKYILGVRVEFMKRGYNWFTVKPPLPIKVPGICKSINVWVVGRGYSHELWLMIRDYHGNRRYLQSMMKLNHRGWRRMRFPIRDDKIEQNDYKVTDPKKVGITFDGFLIQCDPLESRGKYYIYFDLLTAEVDLYFEFQKDEDDVPDFW